MPYMHITLTRPLSRDRQQVLAEACTQLLADGLRKRHEVSAVRISLSQDTWTIGGTPQGPENGPCHGEVFITAGTNSSEEKSRFITNWHALIQASCGPLAEASYLVIHEIPADAWGYDGHTQAWRQARRTPL